MPSTIWHESVHRVPLSFCLYSALCCICFENSDFFARPHQFNPFMRSILQTFQFLGKILLQSIYSTYKKKKSNENWGDTEFTATKMKYFVIWIDEWRPLWKKDSISPATHCERFFSQFRLWAVYYQLRVYIWYLIEYFGFTWALGHFQSHSNQIP